MKLIDLLNVLDYEECIKIKVVNGTHVIESNRFMHKELIPRRYHSCYIIKVKINTLTEVSISHEK